MKKITFSIAIKSTKVLGISLTKKKQAPPCIYFYKNLTVIKMLLDRKIRYIKMSLSSKTINKFNVMSIEVPK